MTRMTLDRGARMFRPYVVATIAACGLTAAGCGTDSSPVAPSPARRPLSVPRTTSPARGRWSFGGRAGSSVPGAGTVSSWRSAPPHAASFNSAVGTRTSKHGVSIDHFVERPNGGESSLFKSDGKVGLLLFPESAEDICSAAPVAQGTGLWTDQGSNFLGGPRSRQRRLPVPWPGDRPVGAAAPRARGGALPDQAGRVPLHRGQGQGELRRRSPAVMRVVLLTTFATSKKEPLAAMMNRVHQAFTHAGFSEPRIRFQFTDQRSRLRGAAQRVSERNAPGGADRKTGRSECNFAH